MDKQTDDKMIEQMRLHMLSHRPIFTCIGVTQLDEPRMHVEIRVTAVISR